MPGRSATTGWTAGSSEDAIRDRTTAQCVNSWWADVEMAGDTDHPENLFNLVLAESFPLVNTARSLQDVYLDAHLHDTADREILHDPDDRQGGISLRLDSLPQEEIRRLHDLVGRHSMASVRAELEGLFLGPLPSEAEMPGCARATEIWASNGAVAFKTGGWDALRSYVHTELRPWLSQYRKRGGDDRTRIFINMFSYECKVAFYLCYANAWIGLIRSLVDRHGLDPMSERFLRLWHHQNQPIEDPAAPGGVHPDVFFGQILALHPLSAIVHAEPSYLQAIGGWIGHPDYDVLNQRGRVGDCPAYWDMVAAILIAAHEYRRSHERWDERRGVREISGGENRTDPARTMRRLRWPSCSRITPGLAASDALAAPPPWSTSTPISPARDVWKCASSSAAETRDTSGASRSPRTICELLSKSHDGLPGGPSTGQDVETAEIASTGPYTTPASIRRPSLGGCVRILRPGPDGVGSVNGEAPGEVGPRAGPMTAANGTPIHDFIRGRPVGPPPIRTRSISC